MLTKQQLATLRSEPGVNRLGKAISLAGVTQVTVARAVGLPQPCVTARGRSLFTEPCCSGSFAMTD